MGIAAAPSRCLSIVGDGAIVLVLFGRQALWRNGMQDQQSKRCTTCGKHLVANELRPKIGSSKMVCDACLLEKEGQQLHQIRHKYGRPHQLQPATKAGTLFKGATVSKLPHNLGHPPEKNGEN